MNFNPRFKTVFKSSFKPTMRMTGLAVLGLVLASGGAMAQSSVTLGGRMDLGPQIMDNGVGRRTGIDSGVYFSPRFFMKSNEDLGGGLTALMYLESRFRADTSDSIAQYFNAGSYVGLSSKDWGTVTIGRQYVPIFWTFLFADETGPLRLHGYSAVQSVQRSNFARISANASPIKQAGTLDSISNGIYSLNITSAFENNMVVYKTPSFSGLTGMLAYGAPEMYGAGKAKVLGGNLEYRNGGFYTSVAVNEKEGRAPDGGETPQTMRESVVSAAYQITSDLNLWGNYHPWSFSGPNSTKLKGDDWMLGASYRFQKGMLWANYADKTLDRCDQCNSSGFGIGYHYFLSKRSELYTSYAQVNNNANSGNSLNGFAPGELGKKVRGIAFGIAHVF